MRREQILLLLSAMVPNTRAALLALVGAHSVLDPALAARAEQEVGLLTAQACDRPLGACDLAVCDGDVAIQTTAHDEPEGCMWLTLQMRVWRDAAQELVDAARYDFAVSHLIADPGAASLVRVPTQGCPSSTGATLWDLTFSGPQH